MKYTIENLQQIYRAHERSGPRGAYYVWYNAHPVPGNQGTCDVEDFIIDFYTQYNEYAGYSVF